MLILSSKKSTDDIISVVDSGGFSLFKDNFQKNNGTFPYVKKNDVNYITLSKDGKIIGILAFALSDVLEKYRSEKEDKKHNGFAHMFDVEILPDYRGKGYLGTMAKECISMCKKKGQKGVTLMAKDQNLASTYSKKFGFKKYTEDSSPMMELVF